MCESSAELLDLFDEDECSLPDIFIENLSGEQVCEIYQWVRSKSQIYAPHGDPTFWDQVAECDFPIKASDDPARLVIEGQAQPFRHGLTGLSISGIDLPMLTIMVFPGEIQFDYRTGSEWGRPQIVALLDLLWSIQTMAPNAQISYANEGDAVRSVPFEVAWSTFKKGKRDS